MIAMLAAAAIMCADFDGGGAVNIIDLSHAAAAYNTAAPQYDLNLDRMVNILDLALAADQYNQSCPSTSLTPAQTVIANATTLPVDGCLEDAARTQALAEATANAATHTPDLAGAVNGCGYGYAIEEIPWGGDGTGQPVIDALQATPEWALMTTSGYTQIGVGAALSWSGLWYWTVIEAHP